jgi:hypothetical protein
VGYLHLARFPFKIQIFQLISAITLQRPQIVVTGRKEDSVAGNHSLITFVHTDKKVKVKKTMKMFRSESGGKCFSKGSVVGGTGESESNSQQQSAKNLASTSFLIDDILFQRPKVD